MTRSPFAAVFHRKMTTMEKMLSVIIVGYLILVATQSVTFFSISTLFDLIRSGAALTIFAFGVLIVFISGGIDVSFAAIGIVSGYTAVLISKAFAIDNLLFLIVVAIGSSIAVCCSETSCEQRQQL